MGGNRSDVPATSLPPCEVTAKAKGNPVQFKGLLDTNGGVEKALSSQAAAVLVKRDLGKHREEGRKA